MISELSKEKAKIMFIIVVVVFICFISYKLFYIFR